MAHRDPKRSRTTANASALASRVLGDPYLGRKIRMMAIHAELQQAFSLAAYVHYYPFIDYPWEEADEYFGYDTEGYWEKIRKPIARTLGNLPRPPPGTYGTPEEIKARREREREFLHDLREQKREELEEAFGKAYATAWGG